MRSKEFFGGAVKVPEYAPILPVIGAILLVYFVMTGQLPWQLLLVGFLLNADFIKVDTFKLFSWK